MFVLIDREQMCVRYRHVNQNVLNNLMAIEFTNTSVVSMSDDQPESYNLFTDLELKLLYLNLTGQKYVGYSRIVLINAVIAVVQTLSPDVLNGFELSLQAGHIRDDELGFFKHTPGAQAPTRMETLYTPKARTAVAGYTPAPVTPNAALAAPASAMQAASTPTIPRNTSGAPVSAEAPKAGSKTGRVWEIGEAILESHPSRPTDFKALRKLIVNACEAEGINGSTASVQFSKWKATKV